MSVENDLLVVKVGSSSLLDEQHRLKQDCFDTVAGQAQAFEGDVVVVTSGAISAGCEEMGVDRANYEQDLVGLRWLAATGQPALMKRWHQAFGSYEQKVSQFLITPFELSIEHESAQFIETLSRGLGEGTVAIVNENDAIADEEIKVGDNDRLSARIATTLAKTRQWSRVSLILLGDTDGLYRNYDDEERTLIGEVSDVSTVRRWANGSSTGHGTGGMYTKLDAAEIACSAGVDTYIANAREQHAIQKTLAGTMGTHFVAKTVDTVLV